MRINTYVYLPKNLKFAALKPLKSNKYLTCFSRISLLNYSHQKLNLGAWSAALLFAFRLPFGHENIFPARERIILSFAFALLKFFFFLFRSFLRGGKGGGCFVFPLPFLLLLFCRFVSVHFCPAGWADVFLWLHSKSQIQSQGSSLLLPVWPWISQVEVAKPRLVPFSACQIPHKSS